MKIKAYFRAVIALLIIVLTVWAVIATKYAKNNKNDAKRYYENLLNSGFELQKLETRLGETQYKVNGLNLTNSELKDINSSLTKRVTDLNIKLKKAEGIIQIVPEYNIVIDTFYIDTNSTIKTFIYSDEWIKLNGYFNTNNRYIIDSVSIKIKDDIIVVPTIEGKWWQCRKKWKVSVRVQSNNPYNKIDTLRYYKFIKK